ncbi:hypothetical protein HK101_001725 [Irineochytrium annulatum]|nr:hypothetical protein HK101_001725 [Irineochytrium annulatum]
MNLATVFLTALAVVASVEGTPVQNDGMITVPLVKRAAKNLHFNKRAAVNRWGARKAVPGHNQRRQVSAPLPNEFDVYYICPVVLGNGQKFKLDLDTGSSDTWFRGPSCTSQDGSCGSPGQKKVAIWDTTLTSTGRNWSTSYGSGSVSGSIFTAPVAIGSKKATISVGVSTSETGFNDASDGLMGLAFASISNIAAAGAGNTNFIDAIGLNPNQFGFYMKFISRSNAKDGDKGEFTMGGADPSKYTGPFTYIPLNAKTYWQASFSGATYAVGSSTGALVRATKDFISDTGTTLIILDVAPATAINKAIGAGAYIATDGVNPIACSIAMTGPTVYMKFGGGNFGIPPNIYVIDDGQGNCFSGFTQGAADAGVAILGDVFTRAWYTLFDKANNRIGYAKAVHPGDKATPTSTTIKPTPTSKSTTSASPTSTSTCAHSVCTAGVKLAPSCDPCAQRVIAMDPYCGTTKWDGICIDEVDFFCKLKC